MRFLASILILASLVALTCCSSPATSAVGDGGGENPGDFPSYTLQDLPQAKNEGKCWTAINGRVYDISTFIQAHPGGNIINEDCGGERTTLFETRPMGSGKPHSSDARRILEPYFIGYYRR